MVTTVVTDKSKESSQRSILLPNWVRRFRYQAILVSLLSMLFYGNTINNEFALDDTAVIVQNEYVWRGFAGIPDILTKDAYDSYFKQINTTDQVRGGRYRPLSIVTFAIEQQLFGALTQQQADSLVRFGVTPIAKEEHDKQFLRLMHIRHGVNVVLFMLSCLVLLYFLRNIVFRHNTMLAFVATVLFVVHPIHTEVVANVKSRDEIMSLLFICLTFISAFAYNRSGKMWMLAAALVSYVLAFLSKEYAITLLLLLPLTFYLFDDKGVKKSAIQSLPYWVVAAVYVVVRLLVMPQRSEFSDSDIQINPYAMAQGTQKLATEIATLLQYLRLMIFPHPLSCDYSYNQIPYEDFTSPVVWVALSVHVLLLAIGIYCFIRRSVVCFGIAFYFINLMMVGNLLFDIGATMCERLVYHSSVGFVVVLAEAIGYAVRRYGWCGRSVVWAPVAIIVLTLCGYKTIARNADWKNDQTLFYQDINVCPNSFLISSNVGSLLVNNADKEPDTAKRTADIRRAIGLFGHALSLQETYALGHLNRSVAYLKLSMPDSAAVDLERVRALYPVHPSLPDLYYYVGLDFYYKNQFQPAAISWQITLNLSPRHQQAMRGLMVIDSLQKAKPN